MHYRFLLGLFLACSVAVAAPEQLLRIHLLPADCTELVRQKFDATIEAWQQTKAPNEAEEKTILGKVAELGRQRDMFLWVQRHTQTLDLFLLKEGENVFWAVVAGFDDYGPLDHFTESLSGRYTFVEREGNTPGVIGFPQEHPLDNEAQNTLKEACEDGKGYPFFVRLAPSVLAGALEGNPFGAFLTDAYKPVLTELKDLDYAELRVFTIPEGLRSILILAARQGTPLHDLFNQKLIAKAPEAHNLLTVNDAFLYGYALLNPTVVSEYLAHYQTLSGKSVTELQSALPYLNGYAAFAFYKGEAAPRIFATGRFNSSTSAQALNAAGMFFEGTQARTAFEVSGASVWKLSKKEEGSERLFVALSDGNILSAPSAESVTALLETLGSSKGASGKMLSKAFTFYPTLCLQAKADASKLWNDLSGAPYSGEKGSLYLAASLGKGRIAFTLDVPKAFAGDLQKFLAQKSAKALPLEGIWGYFSRPEDPAAPEK